MILQIAHDYGIFNLGDLSIDGTKIEANASKHSAMSWGYANKLEEQLKAEVAELIKRAETENRNEGNNFDIPMEIERRQERLPKIEEIQAERKRRASVRDELEKAEYEALMAERAAFEAEKGRRLGGRKPSAPKPGPHDPVNFTDGDSRIMPKSGGDFVQGYNAQAFVDNDTMLIEGQHVSQKTNDKQEVKPALAERDKLPKALGNVTRAALDNGYLSADNVEDITAQGIVPFIANGRQRHNQSLEERLAKPPEAPRHCG